MVAADLDFRTGHVVCNCRFRGVRTAGWKKAISSPNAAFLEQDIQLPGGVFEEAEKEI